MQIENGRVVLGVRDCLCVTGPTPAGTQAGRKACEKCGGTGSGKRGGARGCQSCSGFGRAPDFAHPVPCGMCEGTASVAETMCDPVTAEQFYGVPMRVIRQERGQTWNEAYLAFGYVWTSTDYGRAWGETDDELLARIRRERRPYVQACKIAREDGTLCDFIAVLVHPQGYSLQACFAK